MGNKKLIVMSSIPDSAIDEMRDLSNLDPSFKLDDEFEKKLKDEARWPRNQYLVIPRGTKQEVIKMHNNKEELLKDLIKERAIEPDILVPPLWDEMVKEIKEKSVERKRQLMRLEKEMLVDMVFNLESRNETLVNNLLEVEKMYDKLKCDILDEAMDAMIEKEQEEK